MYCPILLFSSTASKKGQKLQHLSNRWNGNRGRGTGSAYKRSTLSFISNTPAMTITMIIFRVSTAQHISYALRIYLVVDFHFT